MSSVGRTPRSVQATGPRFIISQIVGSRISFVALAAAALGAAVGAVGAIGSDALWLVPLGRLVAHGHLPHSIPFATAPTGGWHDVTAGAQLVFWALYRSLGGVRGLVIAQAVASAVAFGVLGESLRRQAGSGQALLLPIVVAVGSVPAVAVVGAQLFSLALFSILLAFLESEPRRLWPAVPLVALWGNLHGGVLTGIGLLACYVVFHRRHSLPVLAAAVVAVGANPELWHTPDYYRGVFRSAVAREGRGLWAPLGTSAFDLLLIAAALVLLALVLRRRDVRLWEAVALAGLAAGTVHVARTGVFFLFLAAYPAARGLMLAAPRPRVAAAVAVGFAAAAAALLVKAPTDPGSKALAGEAGATGRPVLADAVLGQQVALAGGRVWIDNPIDAFPLADQKLYLDWLDGKPGADRALDHAAFVLVKPGSKAAKRAAHDARLRRVASDAGAVLYRVRAATLPSASS